MGMGRLGYYFVLCVGRPVRGVRLLPLFLCEFLPIDSDSIEKKKRSISGSFSLIQRIIEITDKSLSDEAADEDFTGSSLMVGVRTHPPAMRLVPLPLQGRTITCRAFLFVTAVAGRTNSMNMRFPSLPSIVLHSPDFFQSVKKTRDIASATSLGQTCSLRFDGADFDFVDFSLFDFKD